MSTDTATRTDGRSHDAAPPNRWRLHRGGIVNIWQYAEHTFDLSGGRAIFQGTNGSGKSRTLELLLPLCLDGDLRQIGSKGFDTVSLRRLMLDEYPGGPNRVGYAWIELRRETPEGMDEFLTCGVGVKASKTSQAISDSWRFITSRRVGMNLHLVGADRVPLGPSQLRELLGADCVLDDQAFRAKVAATVYGVPTARYGDLLHLQRTLRNPDVGLKVLEGQLEQILSDALPPLDAGLIERLATSFDDLESIRENIVRLTSADKALSTFLSTYSGYALGTLRDRAETMRSAQERLRSLRSDLSGLNRQVETKRSGRASAQEAVAELEKRESELESSIDALRSHPAYTELQNLRDRERLVESARTAAVTALDTAGKQRAQEDHAVESVVSAHRRLRGDVEAAGQAGERASRLLAAAGLDGGLVPALPAVPTPEPTTFTEQVRGGPEPQAEPVAVERRAAPRLDAEELTGRFRQVTAQAQQAAAAAQERGALTLALHQQAVESDAEQAKVSEAQRLARQAQLAATDASGRRFQAQQELSAAAEEWIDRVHRWSAGWSLSVEDAPVPVPPPADQLVADRTAARQTRERTRQWARPRLQEARRRVGGIEQELDRLRTRARAGETELAELRAGHERTPPRPEWADAERTSAAGSAFHQLVDFHSSLSDADRAGLEAALQASGLLNAWVSTDGNVAGIGELLAAPHEAAAAGTLSDLLVPAAEPDCPVPDERIAALLSSVATSAEADGFAVSVDGSWHAGVLSGTWRKEAAEFVGAGAREGARMRRLAELEEELAQLRDEIGEAELHHREATERIAELEQHLDSYPDDSDLVAAHAKLASSAEAAQETERRVTDLREQHEQAEQRWQATRSELVRSAGEAGLPADTRALDEARRAASEAREAIAALGDVIEHRCVPTLADLREASLHHDAVVADRVEAESRADQRCVEYSDQAAALTELTSAAGGEAQQVADKVSALEQERAQLRRELPRAREKISSLREAGARLETQLENKQAQLAGREADAESALTSFRAALRTPGLWAAAEVKPSEEEATATLPPEDPEEAADLLASATDRKGAGETAVLNRFQALQHSLSGNYDISAGDQGGLLTVTVTGEEGPQPVAEAARRVSERLSEQRGYLNERYQSIFADYLIRDLAERLRGQIDIADDLCKRMNEVLDGARSSQGVHVQLEWQPSAALGDDIRQAIDLVRTPFANRSEEQDALLRGVFTELIEAERDSTTGGYAEILARALDYRAWFAFTVRVRDTGPEGTARVRRLRQLSSGETRLISYVTLFAAAAAFYDAVSASSEDHGPLRLVLLDEAFERLDDPTIARMLGLLVDLDMDWLITWPSGWGVSSKIPKMHIYDVLRPRSGHGIACTHTTWDGREMERADG